MQSVAVVLLKWKSYLEGIQLNDRKKLFNFLEITAKKSSEKPLNGNHI